MNQNMSVNDLNMDSENPLVSVVVPVYNTEQYLEECIESLIHQTLTNIEMIFVDDGSTDRSLEILKNYEKADSRVHVLTQHNQYAGVARNNGMDHATGKYIIFLDSDDFFDLSMLEKMYQDAEDSGAEITVCGFYHYDNQAKAVIDTFVSNKSETYRLEEYGSDIFKKLRPEPWNKLYLRDFIIENDLRFQSLKNTNDVFFTRISIVLANQIRVLNEACMYYRVNNTNSLQGTFDKTSYCFGEAIKAVKDELITRKKFTGNIVDAFYWEAASIMRYYHGKTQSHISEMHLFEYCKGIIEYIRIPESEITFFAEDGMLSAILRGETYSGYLYEQCVTLNQKIVSLKNKNKKLQNSCTYRIGSAVLFIPHKIQSFIQMLKKRSR